MHYSIFRITRLGNLSTFLIVVLLSLISCQQPNLGHSNNKSVYDVVQAAIAKELETEVSLKVEILRQNDEWAFLSGLPLTATEEPIDYSQTKFAADVAEGYFDDGFVALLRKNTEGVDEWTLIALSLGATDAPFVDWPEQFGVPKALVMP